MTLRDLDLTYHPALQLLVCVKCQSCVPGQPRLVFNHVRAMHQNMNVSEAMVALLLEPLECPGREAMQVPPHGTEAVEDLVIHRGWQCPECPFGAPEASTVLQHTRRQHTAAPAPRQLTRCLLQTLGPMVYPGEYFQVRSGPSAPELEPVGPTGPEEDNAANAQAHEEFHRFFQETFQDSQQEPMLGEGQKGLSPWLQRVGWPKHLEGLPHEALVAHRGALPQPQFRALQEAMENLCAQADHAVNTRATHLMKRIIRSPNPKSPLPKPFHLNYEPQTRTRYHRIFLDLICYLLPLATQKEAHPCWSKCSLPQNILDALEKLHRQLSAYTIGADNQPLVDQLLEVFILLLTQDLAGDPFESPLIHGLAVMGYDHKRRSFRDATQYTPNLAGVLFLARLLSLMYLLKPITGRIRKPHLQRVKKWHKEYLADGSPSVVGEVMNQLSFGMEIVRTTPGSTTAVLSECGERIIFCGVPLDLDDIRLVGHSAVQDGYRIMEEHFLIPEQKLESLELSQLRDGLLGDVQSGHSFVTQTRSQQTGYILLELMREPEAHRQYLHRDSDDCPWEVTRDGFQLFEKANQRFLENLFLMLQLCSGPPARGTEMETLRKWNVASFLRNIFVLDGKVFYSTFYHKGQHQNGQQKAVARFLPDPIARLIVAYLLWVMPWLMFPRRKFQPVQSSATADGSLLWIPQGGRKAWTTRDFTRILENRFLQVSGCKVGISDWRQVAKVISRDICNRKLFEQEGYDQEAGEALDHDLSYIEDLMSAHTTTTATLHYGHANHSVLGLNSDTLKRFLVASIEWHRFWKMDKRSLATDWIAATGSDLQHPDGQHTVPESRVGEKRAGGVLQLAEGPSAKRSKSVAVLHCTTFGKLISLRPTSPTRPDGIWEPQRYPQVPKKVSYDADHPIPGFHRIPTSQDEILWTPWTNNRDGESGSSNAR